MKKLVCSVCGYVYDPATGDPDNNFEKGLTLATLPEDFICPVCGVAHDMFTEED